MNLIIPTLLILSALGISFFGIEMLAKKSIISLETSRKITHTGAALIIMIAIVLYGKWPTIIAAFIFIFVMVALRKKEAKFIKHRNKRSYGEVFYPIGTFVAGIIATNNDVFFLAVAILGLADTAAYYVGLKMKKNNPKLLNDKTLLGSFGFFATTLLIIVFFGHISWPATVLIGAIITAVELISSRGSDNLSVPVVAALLLNFF